MKKKKPKEKPIESLDISFSKRRYLDACWDIGINGERVHCFDVVNNQRVGFNSDEWEALKFVELTEEEFRVYKERIKQYWKVRGK